MSRSVTCMSRSPAISNTTDRRTPYIPWTTLSTRQQWRTVTSSIIWKCNSPLDNLVIGSDDECALVKAITTAFPESTHVLCTRHLFTNTKQKLTDLLLLTKTEHVLNVCNLLSARGNRFWRKLSILFQYNYSIELATLKNHRYPGKCKMQFQKRARAIGMLQAGQSARHVILWYI